MQIIFHLQENNKWLSNTKYIHNKNIKAKSQRSNTTDASLLDMD